MVQQMKAETIPESWWLTRALDRPEADGTRPVTVLELDVWSCRPSP